MGEEHKIAKRVVELSMQLANSRADVENLRMRIKAVDKEHEQLKKDRADMVDRFDAALRRAKAEVSLVWTEEPPETPGKYWWRLHSDYEPEIMSVLAYADGTAMRPCDYGHWAGPIALPLDARAAQIEEGE